MLLVQYQLILFLHGTNLAMGRPKAGLPSFSAFQSKLLSKKFVGWGNEKSRGEAKRIYSDNFGSLPRAKSEKSNGKKRYFKPKGTWCKAMLAYPPDVSCHNCPCCRMHYHDDQCTSCKHDECDRHNIFLSRLGIWMIMEDIQVQSWSTLPNWTFSFPPLWHLQLINRGISVFVFL